jgi:hypothetical protein
MIALQSYFQTQCCVLGGEIDSGADGIAFTPGQILENASDISEIDSTFVDHTVIHTPSDRLAIRSEVADLMTGNTIPVEGGWHLRRFQVLTRFHPNQIGATTKMRKPR